MSNETKHTPGPWYAHWGHPTTSRVASIKSPSRYVGLEVADVYGTDERDLDNENTANAHLIAAAPELLEALEALEDAGYLNDIYAPTAEKVRAAITKARGVKE